MLEARQNKQFFYSLESMRGVAALVIAIFHIAWWNPTMSLHFMQSGYLMVDFFFVLSGFVIFHIYNEKLNGPADIGKFMWLRWGRLFPLHLVFLFVFAGIEIAKYFAQERFGLIPNTPLFSVNNPESFLSGIFLLHSMGLHDQLTFNVPSWSISVEFYTYLLFAAIIYLTRSRTTYVILAVLLVFDAFIRLYVAGKTSLDVNYDLGFFRCVGGFFLGTLVYLVYQRIRQTVVSSAAAMIPVLVMLATIVFLAAKPSGMWDYAFPFISAALILSLTALPYNPLSSLLETAPLRWLGRISYSIYMVHFAVIWVMTQVMRLGLQPGKVTSPISGEPILNPDILTGSVFAIITIGICLTIAHFTYRWIELPARNLAADLIGKPVTNNHPKPVPSQSASH